MLIEFSVANYRSFRERQSFSMTAAPRLGKKQNTFPSAVDGEKLPALLKAAAIYGGNASGKSSFIKALSTIEALIKRAPKADSDPLPVFPFRFDSLLLSQPSEFEIHFITKGVRYQYKISATSERIMGEEMISYPRGRETILYSRTHQDGADVYTFGEALEGGEILHNVWVSLTGPKTLFLAQAVANSNETLKQLKNPHHWLTHGMFIFEDGPSQLDQLATRAPLDSEIISTSISRFLRDVDVPVTQIRSENPESSTTKEVGVEDQDADKARRGKNKKITLTHETRLGSADFDLSEESSGTRNLIGFWLPWFALSTGVRDDERYNTIIIDEFDSSLHPDLVAHLIRKHINSESRTQLIFTTHDTHLMSENLLRRDQFWMTDRNGNGATRLNSIYSYEGREGEDIETRYYAGKYRGMPVRRGEN